MYSERNNETASSGASVAENSVADVAMLDLPGEIVTDEFTLGRSVHARLALAEKSAVFWCSVSLPLIVLAVGGFYYDTRLLFVAAAILFILFPTLLMITWYSLLSRPWTIASVFPQTVTLNADDEIVVDYKALPNAEAASAPPARLVILPSEVSDCRIWGDYIAVNYSDNRELIIPLASFRKPTDSTEFLARFDRLRR